MTPTFMACIDALSPAPSTIMRMHRSCSPTILSVIARASDSAWARASCGLPGTRSIVWRQARAASAYWRSQRSRASRWRASFRCRSARARLAAWTAAEVASSAGTAYDGTVSAASMSPRLESLAASTGGAPSEPDPDCVSSSSCGPRSLCRGFQRTVRRPSERIVATCAALVMRKLLSGNGCFIQPMSR